MFNRLYFSLHRFLMSLFLLLFFAFEFINLILQRRNFSRGILIQGLSLISVHSIQDGNFILVAATKMFDGFSQFDLSGLSFFLFLPQSFQESILLRREFRAKRSKNF